MPVVNEAGNCRGTAELLWGIWQVAAGELMNGGGK
jgi:hypothetical protein